MEQKDLNKSKKNYGLNHDHDGYQDNGDDYDKEEYIAHVIFYNFNL